MVLEHLGSGMTLRALVPATGTTCGDIVLGVPQHPIPAEAVLKPSFGPIYPLVSSCRDVMTQPEDFLPELPGDHKKPLSPSSSEFLKRTLSSKRNRSRLM